MTDIKVHNAKEILIEALDTIKATYWITGKEFTFAEGEIVFSNEGDTYDWTGWESTEKAILATLHENGEWDDNWENPNVGKAKVTGVCSIGALALANVTLYDEPLDRWDSIASRDVATWRTGAVLAREIVFDGASLPAEGEDGFDEENPPRFWIEGHGDNGSIIAAWNDAPYRTRAQVIEMFERAINSPLVTAEELYVITFLNHYEEVREIPGIYFTTAQEGQDFLDSEVPLRNFIVQMYGYAGREFTVKLAQALQPVNA